MINLVGRWAPRAPGLGLGRRPRPGPWLGLGVAMGFGLVAVPASAQGPDASRSAMVPAQPMRPPPDDGAYVIEPPRDEPPPPQAPPHDMPSDIPFSSRDEGALLMAMIAVRPFGTAIAAGGADGSDDPKGVVAGHVGMRGHATGVTEDLILRFDLEGFIGASTEGVEGEGRAFMSFGLATPIAGPNLAFFRFGAGGTLLGNPVVDYQAADLPALEFGWVHLGADGFVELAPRVAMAVSRVHAFATGTLEPDPAPAIGGRFLVGGESLWGTVDYEFISGEHPLQLALLTGCFAQKFAVCLDGRLATASLDFAAPVGRERLVALSGGVSFGLGVSEVEH